jgi:hypothetical protein
MVSAFVTITLSLTYPIIRRYRHRLFTLLLISGIFGTSKSAILTLSCHTLD